MTENEIKILFHLNKVRSQNNIDDTLSEMLSITKHDISLIISSLLDKNYIYEDSNTNQKNLGQKAWKITNQGEIKVNEIQRELDIEKENKLQKEIKENAEATNNLARKTFYVTVLGTFAVVFQAYFAHRQNELIEEQNILQMQNIIESQISKQSKSTDNSSFDRILNLVAELKIVKDKIKLIDSLSKGKRQISLVPILLDSSKNIYIVKVGEDNGNNMVTYFNFKVDANELKIINPTGKLD